MCTFAARCGPLQRLDILHFIQPVNLKGRQRFPSSDEPRKTIDVDEVAAESATRTEQGHHMQQRRDACFRKYGAGAPIEYWKLLYGIASHGLAAYGVRGSELEEYLLPYG